MKLFDDYSKIVFEATYKTKYGEELKILTLKQILQRLLIALAHVKAVITSEIRQIIYSCYQEKEVPKTVYSNVMNLMHI